MAFFKMMTRNALFLVAASIAFAPTSATSTFTTETVPMETGHLLWSEKTTDDEIGQENEIFYRNEKIYFSDRKCNIHVLGLERNNIGNIDGDESALCPAPLAFAVDSSFFVQAQTHNDASENVYTTVVAYNATSLDMVYNLTIPGIVEGSPIVSSHGTYTYVVSNLKNNNETSIGQFRIIQNVDGMTLFTESSVDGVAYAPLGIGRSPERGNYGTGKNNTQDILIWGEKFLLERGEDDANGVTKFEGKIHYFQLPMKFDPVDGVSPLKSRSGGKIDKVTLSAPLVPEHGQGAIFSFQAGQLRGWSKGRHFGKTPTLKYAVPKEFNNPAPSLKSGIFAFNDTIHIFASPSGQPYLYAFELKENTTDVLESSAEQLWNISTSSAIISRVQTAFDDALAYYFESEGDLVCIDTLSGVQQWRHQTGGHVKADFTIIDDTYLVYGTTNGYISVLRIGDLRSTSPSCTPTTVLTGKPSNTPSVTPTKVPTSIPSVNPTKVPTPLPSVVPTGSPIVESSQEPSNSPTPWPTPSGTLSPTVKDSEQPSQVATYYPTAHATNSENAAVATFEDVTNTGATFKFPSFLFSAISALTTLVLL